MLFPFFYKRLTLVSNKYRYRYLGALRIPNGRDMFRGF